MRSSWYLTMTVVVSAVALSARAQAPVGSNLDLEHDPIVCIEPGTFARVCTPARAPGIAQAKVYFRTGDSVTWYYVEMAPAGSDTKDEPDGNDGSCATLPSPLASSTSIVYYLEVVDQEFQTAATPPFEVEVQAEGCSTAVVAAPAALSVFNAATGGLEAPAGFATTGLATGSAAAAPAEAAAGVAAPETAAEGGAAEAAAGGGVSEAATGESGSGAATGGAATGAAAGGGISGVTVGLAVGAAAAAAAGIAIAASGGEDMGGSAMTAAPTSYTISSGASPTEQILVDNMMRLFVNDAHLADIEGMCLGNFVCVAPPFTFTARPGDSLTIEAWDWGRDYHLRPVWIHRQGLSRQLTGGVESCSVPSYPCGPMGTPDLPPPGVMFFRQTFPLP